MKISKTLAVLGIALVTTLTFASSTVKASEELSITIHKYGYSKEYKTLVKEGMTVAEIQKVLSEDKQLSPIKGVKYSLYRVEAASSSPIKADNSSTFTKKEPSFKLETDINGIASVTQSQGLVKGYYILEEEKHDKVKSPEKPLLITVPYKTNNAVNVFPKSELVPDPDPTPSPGGVTPESSTTPSTSTSETTTETSETTPSERSTTPSTTEKKILPPTEVKNPPTKENDLPQTGETKTILGVVGLGILVFVAVFMLRNRKGVKTDE